MHNQYHGNKQYTVDDEEIRISDLIPGQNYQLSVEPNYRFIKGTALQRGVSTQHQVPNPLQVVDTGEASVRLEWEKPSGPVKKYTVKYSQNDKNVEKTVLPP